MTRIYLSWALEWWRRFALEGRGAEAEERTDGERDVR